MKPPQQYSLQTIPLSTSVFSLFLQNVVINLSMVCLCFVSKSDIDSSFGYRASRRWAWASTHWEKSLLHPA